MRERDLPAIRPPYRHLVWNRTDLIGGAGGIDANQLGSYGSARPPVVNEAFPPPNYKGEIIPPYAAMRVFSNPVWYKDELCYMVCRPDDNSVLYQSPGMHFINGPSPIPVGRWGRGANEFPVPVLFDGTVGQDAPPYGNLAAAPGNPDSVGFGFVGLLAGYIAGSWAVHPSADIVIAQGIFPNGMFTAQSGGSTFLAVTFPYVILGQFPTPITPLPEIGPTDSPTLQFKYSKQVVLIDKGSLGFGSVTATS